MRKTYRRVNNKLYWDKRWEDIPADQPMVNDKVYPLKYAKETVKTEDGRILEAGCGAGRILRYYHNNGYDIIGIDFIEVAITKLKQSDPSLKVEVGDITSLNYKDETFRYLLAFGLYHNLEHDLQEALKESYRVLEKGGSICASFRADNLQTRLTDWLTERRSKRYSTEKPSEFHKMNLTRKEFRQVMEAQGFVVTSISAVENMPILYKFPIFRAYAHKNFDENVARAEGYKLSKFGQICQKSLMYLFPNQFCNIYVLQGRKPL